MRSLPTNFTPPVKAAPLQLSEREIEGYSLRAAIDAARSGSWFQSGFEREVSEELVSRAGVTPLDQHSFFVPPQILAQRDLTAASVGGGGYLVGTDVGGVVDYLRPLLVASRLGAQSWTGLRENETLARQGATVTTAWHSNEASSATETATLTLSSMGLSPKTVSANIELSRLLRLMSPTLAERTVRRDLAAGLAVAVDAATINGSGSSGQPTGLLQASGIGSFSGTTLAYATLLDAQADVLTANGVGATGEMGFACRPEVAKLLANRQGFSSNSPMWLGSLAKGQLLGANAITSMNVPADILIGGDFSQLVIAEWGGLQIRVNPYSSFQAGITGIAAFMIIDVGVLNPASFTASSTVS